MSYRPDTPQEWKLGKLVDQIRELEKGLGALERRGDARMVKALRGRYGELLGELNRRTS